MQHQGFPTSCQRLPFTPANPPTSAYLVMPACPAKLCPHLSPLAHAATTPSCPAALPEPQAEEGLQGGHAAAPGAGPAPSHLAGWPVSASGTLAAAVWHGRHSWTQPGNSQASANPCCVNNAAPGYAMSTGGTVCSAAMRRCLIGCTNPQTCTNPTALHPWRMMCHFSTAIFLLCLCPKS